MTKFFIPLLLFSSSLLAQDMSNSIGVLSLAAEINGPFKIEILNEDGSVWYSVDPFGEFEWKEGFDVLAFKPDYFLFKLKCVLELDDSYEVVVNEKTGETKFIKKSSNYKLQSWEEFVQQVFSIAFDPTKQKLLDNIDGNPIHELPKVEDHIVPNEIQGDWMKVIWTDAEYPDETTENKSGWLKWRDGDQIIIGLYFLS